MFERTLGIDWSGAGRWSSRTSSIAVVDGEQVVRPPRYRNWNRTELEDFLIAQLEPLAPRAIVGIDAALSYAFGFQRAVFGAATWGEMVDAFGEHWKGFDTARELATDINSRFPNGGPFRFDDSRNDPRFYQEHRVAYWRATEMLTPQCISPFYLGSGAAVGFHTLTAMRTLARLRALRDAGRVDFEVWPFERRGARHVLAEVYPALLPSVGVGSTPDEEDAAKIAKWLRCGSFDLKVPNVSTGHRSDVTWGEQIAFEGWILGI